MQYGNLTKCVRTNCYSSCHEHVTHNYEYSGFRTFHRGQLITQSTTDVCVHLSVMSLLGRTIVTGTGQTKVCWNRGHPTVDRGLNMVICGTMLTGRN